MMKIQSKILHQHSECLSSKELTFAAYKQIIAQWVEEKQDG